MKTPEQTTPNSRLRWILLAGLAIILSACLSYPLWDGYGPWTDFPTDPAPRSQNILDPRFTEVAHEALAAIAQHRANHQFPALTAAVALQGNLLWTGAVGWADLEHQVPAAETTVMRIGSTSKAVTATALARLIDQGEMALDAPLSDYAPDWPHPQWHRLTPRQLASHTAGFPEYQNNGDRLGRLGTLRGKRHYATVRESLALFDAAPLLYEPGTDFAYSSFDVNLLGAAMAESQKQPFLTVLKEQIFQPLNLKASGGDNDGIDRPHLAQFYETKGKEYRRWRPFDLSQRWPGGGLVSTSAELAIIGGHWMNPDFISASTRQAMWTPQRLKNGEVNEQSYAIGWRYYPDATWPGDPARALPFAHHGGISKGAMSWLVVYPDPALSVAININTRADQFSDFNSVEGRLTQLFLQRLEQLNATESQE